MRKTICKNKRLLRNKTLKGGATVPITPNILERVGLKRYTNHIIILKNYFLKGLAQRGSLIISYLGSGFNGFTLKVEYLTRQEPARRVVNAYKILFNKIDPTTYRVQWLKDINIKLEREYDNMKTLAHCKASQVAGLRLIGLVQTSGYLVFDGRGFTGFIDKEGRKDIRIEDGIMDESQVAFDEGKKKQFEGFGVLIMEYIEHRLSNIAFHIEGYGFRRKVQTLAKLFWGYLTGINCISKANMIHSDIKLDNLMYNKDGEEYKAKIVDLANLKSIKHNTSFTSNSQLGIVVHARMKNLLEQAQINLEIGLQKAPRYAPGVRNVDKRTIQDRAEKLRNNILKRYDLYCLAITFHNLMLGEGSTLRPLLTPGKMSGVEGKVANAYIRFTRLLNEFATFEIDGIRKADRITRIEDLKDNDNVLGILESIIADCI